MNARLRVALWLGAGLIVAGCRAQATPDECRDMNEHYVDFVIAEDPALAKLDAAQLAAVRDVKRELQRGQPGYRKAADHCEAVTRKEYSCAMGAKKAAEWEACFP
jgi:hypothetical protein